MFDFIILSLNVQKIQNGTCKFGSSLRIIYMNQSSFGVLCSEEFDFCKRFIILVFLATIMKGDIVDIVL